MATHHDNHDPWAHLDPATAPLDAYPSTHLFGDAYPSTPRLKPSQPLSRPQ